MSRRGIDEAVQRRVPGTWPLRMLARAADDPLIAGGMLVMVLASAAIVSNALLLQSGRHPAPLFQTGPVNQSAMPAARIDTVQVTSRPIVVATSTSLVRDIQLALIDRNMYGGPVDGLAGRMTKQAIAGFEQAAGLPVSGKATLQLLAHLQMADVGSTNRALPKSVPAQKPVETPIADKKTAQIQKALNNLGYGPLEVDGLMGAATAKAIRGFELDRGLPITGRIGKRLTSEFVSIGGLPR